MERLTERELYDGKVCFTKCSKTNCLDTCTNCDIPKEANVRLKEYEDLEEKGKLLRLPCAVGDWVYVIKGSVKNYNKVVLIEVCGNKKSDVYFKSSYDQEKMAFCTLDDFEKTVFLTEEEADAALEELKRK